MKTLLLALGFMAIFEGLMPLLMPEAWKKALAQLIELPAETLRKIAAMLIGAGLILVWLINELM